MGKQLQSATLAGGCFWCLEAVFDELKGVEAVESGYSGGHLPNPSYEDVCSGASGYAEVVQIHFDPDVISFHDLLMVFFSVHDPTSLNRQGNDIGTQYRSAIFHHDVEQQEIAQQAIREISAAGLWQAPIVTEIKPFERFHAAEAYHQEYYQRNRLQGYCQMVITPKVAKFRKQFAERLKK